MTRFIQFAPAREVLAPQRNFCAESDGVAFKPYPLFVKAHGVFSRTGFRHFEGIAPFGRARHHHRIRRESPAFLSRQLDSTRLANNALQATAAVPSSFKSRWFHKVIYSGVSRLPAAVPELGR